MVVMEYARAVQAFAHNTTLYINTKLFVIINLQNVEYNIWLLW